MSYCTFCSGLEVGHLHKIYHDEHYGFKIDSDDELFGRLILEINQAGLSWDIILKKQVNFRNAFDSFSCEKVSNYNEEKIGELLQDAGIVRNRLKINAVIHNAKQIVELQKEHGSFKSWLDQNKGLSLQEWVKLFKKNFKFVGGEIVNEFLMSTGYLEGAHSTDCEIYPKANAFNLL